MSDKPLTNNFGAPVPDNEHSLSAGERGPLLLQDHFLIEKLAHFDRERIPERVVHAKGAGAFGYFEASSDMSRYTRAHLFGEVGRKTPVLVRFSTVGGEKGSADADRDPRGFAIKFYTEEGNYDLVGNNTPVFFIRDPFKFPDMVHTHKRNPQTNLKDPNAFWDFFSHSPESTHMVTVLFSDRGIPRSYRHMHGFGSHTFKWVNAQGEAYWVKYHFKTQAGIQNLTAAEAAEISGRDPDHATRDLFEHIKQGGRAVWKAYVQIMPLAAADTYRYDPFDVTKVWRYKDYPLIPIGQLVLDRNPDNFFAEMEQAAFSPSTLVPGIEPSPDKLLQGRLFSYPDTQRHRLGTNYALIPVNCPYARKATNYQRDGLMRVDGNGGSAPNYSPNSAHGPVADPRAAEQPIPLHGTSGRTEYNQVQRADDFEQAGLLYRVMPEEERARLIANIAGHLGQAQRDVQRRQVQHFLEADIEYGQRVIRALGIEVTERATA
ncbi:MAG TPA: catalase [Steroidobacteraceae bacterium]|nr:catalase [Steroidobacteraceae bacterium]